MKRIIAYLMMSVCMLPAMAGSNITHSAPIDKSIVSGPRNFAPEGSNTWNSQTSFILPIVNGSDTTFMFMGDRWSFPKQRSAATYVWQPIVWTDGEPALPEYFEAWSPTDASKITLELKSMENSAWEGSSPGDNKQYQLSVGENEKHIRKQSPRHNDYRSRDNMRIIIR